eukprot:COSAG05_NODE_1251_length_5381_cov_82.840591_7_plen_67_part_00
MGLAGYTRRGNLPNPYSITGRKGEGCMALVCANSKRDDNQQQLLPIRTVGRYRKGEAAGSQAGDCS